MHYRSVAALLALTTSLACGSKPATPASPDANGGGTATSGCARTSVGLAPLTDMGAQTYQGTPGGLYPNGGNLAPPSHLQAGLSLARAIGPLNAQGQPSPIGRYAFISVGMSNTTQEFSTFIPMASADGTRDSRLAIIDGAQGGQTGTAWSNPGCPCWSTLDSRLANAGISAGQVTVAWIKLADAQPSEGWPTHARRLTDETIAILRLLKSRFANLKLAYLSSRIYAGYATTTLNPEPYAYEGGFTMRWVIESQLSGGLPYEGASAVSPWVAWGPYLWADGLTPRNDGLTWSCADFGDDGTHPSTSGREKVASRLLDFVHTDPTAREWYLANP